MSKGLIHVYTGDGKGKTTAVFGLAMRAAGHGKKVLVMQFLKSGAKGSGESVFARGSNIKVVKFKGQTTPLFNPRVKLSELKKSVEKAIAASVKEIKSHAYDVVILDEFISLLTGGLATMKDVNKIVNVKPEELELVFTGRGAPEELIEIADYVTEMRMIKHPFHRGVKARKGIEY